jgi:tripartite ATP-independent transporter DctP family solute receptor
MSISIPFISELPRSSALRAAALGTAALFALSACGGFGAEPANDGGGGSAGAADSGPQLSDPPAIEGEVVSEGDEHTIKFGIGLAETSPQYLSVEYFGEILEQRTDGRISVNIFPNSQVGDDKEMMSALQSGSLDMTFPSTSAATTIVPELRVFDLPFLFPTAEDADTVLDGPTGQDILTKFDGTGIKALAWAENGYRQLTNSKGPVESPEDVKGLRLRVMENEMQIDVWKSLGANPTSMAFGEVFSALEQGVVDGQENPWPTIYSSKFNEVQDYGSSTQHVYTPFVMMMSQKLFDTLSPEDQAIVQEAAVAAGKYNRTINREYDDFAREELAAGGMEITELSAEQLKAFQDATQPVYEKWAPEIGDGLVADVQEQIQAD